VKIAFVGSQQTDERDRQTTDGRTTTYMANVRVR